MLVEIWLVVDTGKGRVSLWPFVCTNHFGLSLCILDTMFLKYVLIHVPTPYDLPSFPHVYTHTHTTDKHSPANTRYLSSSVHHTYTYTSSTLLLLLLFLFFIEMEMRVYDNIRIYIAVQTDIWIIWSRAVWSRERKWEREMRAFNVVRIIHVWNS